MRSINLAVTAAAAAAAVAADLRLLCPEMERVTGPNFAEAASRGNICMHEMSLYWEEKYETS